jgi:endonuclease/exonuclease/phosphatase (EEP) superfamily protein YafD
MSQGGRKAAANHCTLKWRRPEIPVSWLWSLFTLFASSAIAGFLSRYNWICELCCNFYVHYAIVFLLLAGLFFLMRSRIGCAFALAFFAICSCQFVPLFISPVPAQRSEQANQNRLRLLYMNVNCANSEYGRAFKVIHDSDPDIVAVSEVTQDWANQLHSALPEYKFGRVFPRPDAFGIALLSRIPIEKADVVYWGPAGVPSILSHMKYNGTAVTILATHPVPPVSARLFGRRNQQLVLIPDSADKFDSSLIVLGDLNATSWSYWFQQFQSRLKLHDTRRGFGVQQTWPVTDAPSVFNLIWITLDHALVSEDWTTINRRVGPPTGSDHLPVYVELTHNQTTKI